MNVQSCVGGVIFVIKNSSKGQRAKPDPWVTLASETETKITGSPSLLTKETRLLALSQPLDNTLRSLAGRCRSDPVSVSASQTRLGAGKSGRGGRPTRGFWGFFLFCVWLVISLFLCHYSLPPPALFFTGSISPQLFLTLSAASSIPGCSFFLLRWSQHVVQ